MADNSENKLRILVVDDSKVILKAFSKILGAEYDIAEAADGEVAWNILQNDETICSVFTDMNMPNVNGLELLTRIRNAEDSILRSIPVILVTSSNDDDNVVQQAFVLGITVLIRKPFDTLMLKSCAKAHVKPRHLSISDDEGKASIDPVTKLANAAYFNDRGEKDRAFSIRQNTPMAVAILGINNYPDLTQSYPLLIRSILIKVSSYIRSMMRQEDTLAHLGSGQFGMLILSINRAHAIELLERIQANISSRVFSYQESKIALTTSIGLSTTVEGQDLEFKSLVNEANINYAEAKKSETDMLIANALAKNAENNYDKQATLLLAMLDRTYNLFQQHQNGITVQHIDAITQKLTPFLKSCHDLVKLKSVALSKKNE